MSAATPLRSTVLRLLALGPLPAEDDPRPQDDMVALLEKYGNALNALERPASDAEALALLDIFNPDPEREDSCFGLAWSVTHFIETAPSWPGPPAATPIGRAIEAQLQDSVVPWHRYLWERCLKWRENHTEAAERP